MPAVQSMTAFARREQTFPWGSLAWEVRSVNHRYLEAQLRLPEAARHLEMAARELLRERIGRGKVDCTLRLHAGRTQPGPLAIDEDTVHRLHEACARVAALTGELGAPTALELLRWPGVLAEQHPDEDEIVRDALGLLGATVDELLAMRAREGTALAAQLEQRLARIDAIVTEVRDALPAIIDAHRQRLHERVAELVATIDPQRLEQEIVLLAARSDVAEELDRLQSHVREARHSLHEAALAGGASTS